MQDSCNRRVYAPGKIVIAGEYAVLDDAPALVLAINRGVSCLVQNGAGIQTPNGDTRFVAPALKEHALAEHFLFEDWNPVLNLGSEKPGFGGSAAACVAACLACGRPAKDAFAIHHRVQGSGSGIDIAASIHGGMIRFQGGAVSEQRLYSPVVIWSGSSAKTGPRVNCYRSWSDRSHFVARSTQLVDSFEQNPIEVLNELYLLLCSMAQQASIDYQTPRLHRIVEIAQKFGGAAKPSGAGGGDCAIALFPSQEQEERFVQACSHESFQIIAIKPAQGAYVEIL